MRTLHFKRLNMNSKHRYSMLCNMTSNLIIHEKIRTTLGKARNLVKIVNNLFKKSYKNNPILIKKTKSILRLPLAYKKFINGMIEKYRNNIGGVVRIVNDPKKRLNDNSKMAIVELLDNKLRLNEDKVYDYMKNELNLSFLDWEMFTREKELLSYKFEKEKRKNLYQKIQNIIKECKQIAKETNEKFEYLIQERLFGDVDVNKIKHDYRIPPQHNIQFYIKAMNPTELESYYKNSEYYLTKLINRTNNQLEYLNRIKSDEKKAHKYEKRNYLRFIGNENIENLKESYKKEIDKENHYNYIQYNDICRKLEILNENKSKEIAHEVNILKKIDDHIKGNQYHKFSLTPEQKSELNKIRKMEFLRKELIDQTKSDEDLVKEFKEKKNDYRTKYYKNNDNFYIDDFKLTYSQKSIATFKNEELFELIDNEDKEKIGSEIKQMRNSNKYVDEYMKRKNVENSLRKRKRYHLPALKRMKTSLDKYSNENEYYVVQSLKRSGIIIDKKKDLDKQIEI